MKIEELMAKIFYAISVVVGIIMIMVLVYKVLGHSPTATDIILGLQMLTITGVMSLAYNFGTFKGEVRQFMRNTEQRFLGIEATLKEIQKELKELREDSIKIKEKLNNHITQSA